MSKIKKLEELRKTNKEREDKVLTGEMFKYITLLENHDLETRAD